MKNSSLILLCGIALLPGISSAAEWSVTKGVATSLTITDNDHLTEGGKQSEVIASASPKLSFTGKGARASVKFTGSVKIDDQGRGNDSINPRIQADADAELVEDLFYVDAKARASQYALNPYTSGGDDTTNDSGNVTTTYSYSVSPYIKRRLKGYADFEARYTYDQLFHTSDQAGDSTGQSVAVSLDSGRKFKSFSWGLNGDYRKVDAQKSDNSDYKSADANFGYRFDHSIMARASVGKEWNDYTTTRSDTGGARWDAGLVWTPSPRTSLDIGYGERYFGSTPSFDFTHRSRKSTFEAGYSRELTDSRSLIMDQELYFLVDEFGNVVVDPITGNPFIIARDVAVINDVTLVNERFDASYTLKGKRTTLKLRADHSKQIYQDVNDSGSKLMGLSIALDRRLDGKTSANTDISWRRSEMSDGSQADTTSFKVGMARELGQKSNLRLDYRHTERDSDTAGDSYDENRVTVALDIDL